MSNIIIKHVHATHTCAQELEGSASQLKDLHAQHAASQKAASETEASLRAKVAALEDEVRHPTDPH